ncbi:DUF4157 domain-containing protein [Streptomyces sp. NPDC001657]|uniref:eCIS core domain-containing protein n=1 Tax=Streptomyces sp. NPDC001657 TaxID=3154522 RepID=UPI00332753B3
MTDFSRLPRIHREQPQSGPAPGTHPEEEADRAAQRALSSSTALGTAPSSDVPRGLGQRPLPGTGRPLDEAGRMFFERRLGTDLGRVRIHDDASAARAADAEHARGFTFGEHVVLAADADREVLAHELVHVLQQRRAGRTEVQRQERSPGRPVPLGPPAAPFDVVRARAPREDARVMFRHDSIRLLGVDLTSLRPVLQGDRPLAVDVDGYASHEGDPEHNDHLSAHRAAAVAAVLSALLPAGSVVRLHAHGATTEFGEDPANNRRAGIRVAELTQPTTPPHTTPPGNPPMKLELRMDPGNPPLRPDALPDVPDLRLREPVPPYRDPMRPLPSLRPPQPAGNALPPFTPPPPHPSLIDWPGLRQTFAEHGAGGIDTRTALAVESFTRDWYQHYLALGIPEETARKLANLGTRIHVARELGKEGNTEADRAEDQLRRQGVTTQGGSIDLLDLLRRLRKK